MNKDVKAKWVAALRSGEYKQTQNRLREGNAFCCLGVLCNLHAKAHRRIAADQTRPSVYMDHTHELPEDVMVWAGLGTDIGDKVVINGRKRSLAEHNDQGRTFKQIADAIEAQL